MQYKSTRIISDDVRAYYALARRHEAPQSGAIQGPFRRAIIAASVRLAMQQNKEATQHGTNA